MNERPRDCAHLSIPPLHRYVFDVYTFRTNPSLVMEILKEEISQQVGPLSTGVVVLEFKGPMAGTDHMEEERESIAGTLLDRILYIGENPPSSLGNGRCVQVYSGCPSDLIEELVWRKPVQKKVAMFGDGREEPRLDAAIAEEKSFDSLGPPNVSYWDGEACTLTKSDGTVIKFDKPDLGSK